MRRAISTPSGVQPALAAASRSAGFQSDGSRKTSTSACVVESASSTAAAAPTAADWGVLAASAAAAAAAVASSSSMHASNASGEKGRPAMSIASMAHSESLSAGAAMLSAARPSGMRSGAPTARSVCAHRKRTSRVPETASFAASIVRVDGVSPRARW